MDFIGNNTVVSFLNRLTFLIKENKKVDSGSFILSGQNGLGKKTILKQFINNVICQNNSSLACGSCLACQRFNKNIWPDFYRLKRDDDKKNISVNQIRQLINQLSLSSFSDSYKFALIEGADNLSEEAANSLLKTLEEPNSKTFIFLVTSKIEKLPKTIVSRSQILNFYAVKKDLIYQKLLDIGANRSMAKNITSLCGGRPGFAIKMFIDENHYKEEVNYAEIFIDILNADITSRFLELDKLVNKKLKESEMFFLAEKILNTWFLIARDIYLLKLGQNDLLRYVSLLLKLEKLKNNLDFSDLINIFSVLNESKNNLKANVNAKLTLESVLINI